MDHPLVDIICLVHNRLPITKKFVHYIFQNTSNFRLIFIDNGSSDKTPEYLKQGVLDKKWDVVSSAKNLGVIGGRNLGAQHVTSDYFLNIDNDQFVKKGWLDGLFNLMNKGYDIVGPEAWQLLPPKSSGAMVMGGKIIPDRSYFPFKHCEKLNDKFSYIGCGGMLIKKKVYDDIGLFDERYSPAYYEDPDFCWRAIKAGYKLGWKYNCPIIHLAHQTFNNQALFQKNEQFMKSWLKFREKWDGYFPDLMANEI